LIPKPDLHRVVPGVFENATLGDLLAALEEPTHLPRCTPEALGVVPEFVNVEVDSGVERDSVGDAVGVAGDAGDEGGVGCGGGGGGGGWGEGEGEAGVAARGGAHAGAAVHGAANGVFEAP